MQHLYLGSVLLATFARPCDGYRGILTFSRCGLALSECGVEADSYSLGEILHQPVLTLQHSENSV